MNEYSASYSRLELIVNAAQFMKDNLTCRICLELFNEPVTIKCGHKFCKSCILQVASNENIACPFCNLKITKRSIPKVRNELLQSCVDKFNDLADAILKDSGIDVTQPFNKAKHTKESAIGNEKLDTSKLEVASVTSFSGLSLANQSVVSKILPSSISKSKRLSLRKQKQSPNNLLKTQTSVKNTLHKYLSTRIDTECDHDIVQSNEKVSNWLKNVTPVIRDSTHTDSDIDDAPSTSKNKEISSGEKSPPFTLLKNSYEASFPKTYAPANKATVVSPQNENQETDQEVDESKFKQVQMRVQEADIMARKKKLSQTAPETILKTPCSIPATAHSDAGDWKRVKKVGKEMQVKTFKSLHVSVEKNSSSAVIEENELCQPSDNKNIKESDIKDSSRESTAAKEKQKKIKKTDSAQDIKQDHRQRSGDSTASLKEENVSAFVISKSKVEEIIGVKLNNSDTSKQKKKLLNIINTEIASSLYVENPDNYDIDNKNLDEEPSNVITTSNVLSPQKRKISLQLKTSVNSKTSSSPKTPVKQINDSPIAASPERPKSRLSLRLPSKINESPVKNAKTSLQPTIKSPVKSPSDTLKQSAEIHIKAIKKSYEPQTKSDSKKNLPLNSWKRQPVSFRKLGKVCKKRKVVPFLYLGKLYHNLKGSKSSMTITGLKVTSIVPVNMDYKVCYKTNRSHSKPSSSHFEDVKMLSPEKDSQLKFLALDSPDHLSKKSKTVKQNVPVVNDQNNPIEKMEIDEAPKKDKISKRQLNMEKVENKNEDIPNSLDSLKGKNDTSKLSTSIHNETVVEVVEKKADANHVPDIISKVDSGEENQPEPMETNDNESVKSPNKSEKKSKPVKEKPVEDKDDVISISSNESRRRLVNTRSRRKSANKHFSELAKESNKISEIESTVDSDSEIYDAKPNEFVREKSVSASSASTPIKKSSLTKKRTHVESSSDDDNVASIIGKWCDPEDEPLMKKQKVITHVAQVHTVVNQESIFTSDGYIDLEAVEPRVKQLERDPPIDDVIKQVKASKEANVNKLHNLPSSLNSADLFDTNDQSIILPTAPRLQKKALRAAERGDSSSNNSSPSKNSDKENCRDNGEPDITIVDKNQFKTNKLNFSEKLDNSDKENDLVANDEPTKNENNLFHVRDSLINITQEQIAIRKFEKDLIGIDLSVAQSPKNDEKFATPTKKKEPSQLESEFETDNIDATPVVKKKQNFIFPKIQPVESEPNDYELSLPDRNPDVIPAITPMKNTKSYPLCHSTPMSSISPLKRSTHSRNIILVCSGLTANNIKVVQEFAKKFRANFKSNFTMDVTHVILNTDPEMKFGQKTSKYIQGIAFKKYVVSFKWILDCLKQNTLLDEGDKKYEVLDPDTLENGAQKSRERIANLFDGFAVYCSEPFTSLPVDDFKNVLLFNGAVVTNTPKELSFQKNKFKLVILESEDLQPWQITLLKQSGGVLVSFEWVIDCISQYSLLSLVQYLYETSIEEAMELGIPPEYLIIEDNQEEDE